MSDHKISQRTFKRMSYHDKIQLGGIEMADLFESHKSNWTPDSKGGEPNCRREDSNA